MHGLSLQSNVTEEKEDILCNAVTVPSCCNLGFFARDLTDIIYITFTLHLRYPGSEKKSHSNHVCVMQGLVIL